MQPLFRPILLQEKASVLMGFLSAVYRKGYGYILLDTHARPLVGVSDYATIFDYVKVRCSCGERAPEIRTVC